MVIEFHGNSDLSMVIAELLRKPRVVFTPPERFTDFSAKAPFD